MDIFLSINNREQVLKLPVVPEVFEISKPHKNEVFETVNQGDLKLIGLAGLKSIAFNSFFPVRNYPFLRDKTYKGFEYVYILDTWRARRLPIRIIITETPINMPCVIDDFSYRIGPSGDLYYSIVLGEFRFVQLTQRRV